jgi:hypothetical protein
MLAMIIGAEMSVRPSLWSAAKIEIGRVLNRPASVKRGARRIIVGFLNDSVSNSTKRKDYLCASISQHH